MSDDPRPPATETETETEDPARPAPWHRHRLRLAALLVVVVLMVAGGGWWLWHEDHSFCHEVADLPDITGSVDRTGSPADGLVSYADQLDRVASEAPDAQTAEAARTLATAQRAAGQSLQGDPVGTTAASVIASASDSSLSTAQQQLQQSIAQHCPR